MIVDIIIGVAVGVIVVGAAVLFGWHIYKDLTDDSDGGCL